MLTKRQWKVFFRDRGVSEDLIAEYLKYISPLVSRDVPVIFELDHLSNLVGFKSSELVKMLASSDHFYREFKIPKRRGGKRTIYAPYPSLHSIQRWIYKNILLKLNVHEAAHGFVPGCSIVTNAEKHLNQRALLKLDLKDFFPSIPINWIINFFASLGYAKNVSYYLAALCCYDGRLSQGASTSPYLSNLLLVSLDKRLTRLSKKYKLNYTRYADDLTFSGQYIPHELIGVIGDIVAGYGLTVNNSKTKLITKPGQRIVTGLSVSGSTLKIPRATKRELRKEIHFIRKYGYLSHVGKSRIRVPNYLDSLEGKLSFWLHVEPDNRFAVESISYLNNLGQYKE